MSYSMARRCKFCHNCIYDFQLHGKDPDVQYVIRKCTGSRKEYFHKSCLYSIWGKKKGN